MRNENVEVGGKYIAKVNNRLTVVKVTDSEVNRLTNRRLFYAENLSTGRRIYFRSAGRFRRPATDYEVAKCLESRSATK